MEYQQDNIYQIVQRQMHPKRAEYLYRISHV
jgi:hypothetical protein